MRMALLSCLCLSCSVVKAESGGQTASTGKPGYAPDAVRRELRPISFEASTAVPRAINAYLTYYRLDLPCAEHRIGTFVSGRYTLASHIFEVESPRGTVVVMHGYCDHAGIVRKVLKRVTELGYSAATYDMPGHGLSSGERVGVDTFADYVVAFRDFLEICRQNLPPPYHVIAHSTGCSPIIDHLLTQTPPNVDKVVLIAPLVRSASWNISRLGWSVVKPFGDSVPRVFRRNSADKAFLQFLRDDPLQPERIPQNWFRALVDWNKRIGKLDACAKPILIIQGKKDTTVDWRYNIKLLGEKFPRAAIVLIEKGGHQLINEAEPMLGQVLTRVSELLDARGQSSVGRDSR